jgi:hypothetical protein
MKREEEDEELDGAFSFSFLFLFLFSFSFFHIIFTSGTQTWSNSPELFLSSNSLSYFLFGASCGF